MEDIKQNLNLKSIRRFGAELEINAFDGLSKPFIKNELPAGIEYVSNLVKNTTNECVIIHKYGNDHHNSSWVVKPDGSCGMEVCSPVVKGWNGVMRICSVVDSFRKDVKINADHRCSFHVHVDVSDLSEQQLASILTWWVKCEPVFMDLVPLERKSNQYCRFIGQTNILDHVEDGLLSNETLINRLGYSKYNSINTYHLWMKNRKTIEFRIMDSDCCLDAWSAKNWLRLILYFVDRAITRGLPYDYVEGDKWSGYCWLDPLDVFELLEFNSDKHILSPGLEQVKHWFITRMYRYANVPDVKGLFSNNARKVALLQIKDLMKNLSQNLEVSGSEDEIYSSKYRI